MCQSTAARDGCINAKCRFPYYKETGIFVFGESAGNVLCNYDKTREFNIRIKNKNTKEKINGI